MNSPHARLPSIDEILRTPIAAAAVAAHGRLATVAAVRDAVAELRTHITSSPEPITRAELATRAALQAAEHLAAAAQPMVRRVFNLTGTVLHTNLGRAVLPEAAIEAAVLAMRHPAALEFDIATGGRGERDDAIRGLLRELTGAEDAIAVNNNAAAVLLVLNTLGAGRETIVSRGELIEIGGAFRMPDIMARAGTRLVEVGTTNRTHLRDYAGAIGPETGILMKVHTSNYLIQGFTSEVSARDLVPLAHEHKLPVVDDLGSGTLVDLAEFGLRRERTVGDALGEGADLVTFSGDKLLGGAQAGFIVGRRDLVQACARNPMKRAMRLDKIRLAALEATLKLYRDPEGLTASLPTLRLLTRRPEDLRAIAGRLRPALEARVGEMFAVSIVDCRSQIGSGALPLETIPSAGLAATPRNRKAAGRHVAALAAALRALEIPVIGRIEKSALILDLRCLDDEARLASGFASLSLATISTEPQPPPETLDD